MTDLIDHANTDEIPRIDTGEKTERLAPDTLKMIVNAPSFTAIPRGDLTTELPLYVPGPSVGFEGPQKPPPPLPKPPKAAPTEVLSLIDSIVGQSDTKPDEDGDDIVFRRGCGARTVPVAAIVNREPATVLERRRHGRHAAVATFRQGLLIGAGLTLAVYSGLVLAAVAVIR